MPEETRMYEGGRPLAAASEAMGQAETGLVPPALAPAAAAALDATAAAAPQVRMSQPMPVELAPGTPVGEYRVLRKLGEGGMGAVYAGEQPTIGKRVAIKVLAPHCAGDSDLVRRFAEEARAANRIQHPHIIDIFSFGQLPDGRHYFVMEFLEGQSMAEAIDQQSLQPGELRRLLCQICGALEASHQAGIVHRDLKPENIWIARPPHGESYVKLLDFGIAKLLDPTRTNLTQTGAVLGTPLFMAPEQCMGRLVDARTDIYALGVLLYRIFSGQYPFQGTVITELVYQHVAEAPPPPSRHRAMPPDLERIILDCLAKEPAARPQSARVLGERLEAVLATWSEVSAGATVSGSASYSATLPAVAHSSALLEEQPPYRGAGQRKNKSRWLLGLGAVALVTGGVFALRMGPAHESVPIPSVKTEPAPPPKVVPPAPPPLARLRVTVENGPNNRMVLDGKEIARGQDTVELADLEAGKPRRLVVEAPSRKPFVHEFTLSPGGTLEIPVVLQPEEHEPARRSAGKARALAAHAPAPADLPAPLPKEVPPAPAKTEEPLAAPPAPRPTRAQERGLLDSNPLRAAP
jgi:serine/threonine protein kinase